MWLPTQVSEHLGWTLCGWDVGRGEQQLLVQEMAGSGTINVFLFLFLNDLHYLFLCQIVPWDWCYYHAHFTD